MRSITVLSAMIRTDWSREKKDPVFEKMKEEGWLVSKAQVLGQSRI
jgi:hypothetical protein